MKKLLYTILIIFLCLTSFMLISCGGEDDITTEPPITYSITYELNGGTNSAENSSGYNEGDTVILSVPVKENYFFKGWYTDSSFTNQITEIKDKAENITLYAKWVPVASYDITYELNGGTNSAKNPDTYKTGEIITLDYPEKADYMFAGWFTDSALTTEVKEIKNKEENLTLYAKWIPCEDVFNFVENNGCYEIKIAPNYKVETVIIPSHYKGMPVVKITRTAEKHHKLFESVIISDTVTSIDIQAFSNGMGKDMEMCLEYIEVDENNLNFKSVDGVLYSKDEKTLIRYPANKSGETFNIPEKVTVIDDFAFSRNENLISITIPNSVVSIGGSAFNRAESLEGVVISDSVKKIDGYAFYGCTSLKNVTLSNNIQSIEYYTFYGCTSLESVIIPNSVKSIGAWAFGECSALKNIVISTGVNNIGTGAFYKCTLVEGVVIPSSVVTMNGSAFQGCPQLTLYCEAESMPEGWESHLSKNVKEIVWGYKEDNK